MYMKTTGANNLTNCIISGNPSSIGPAPSPQASHTNAEEQAYLDKLKQLRKYIEPLKRMVAKIEKEEGLLLENKFKMNYM